MNEFQGAAGFVDAAVGEVFAKFEGGGEALECELLFAEAQVGEAAEVETVGLAPGVLAIGLLGFVEGGAGVLKGSLRVSGAEERFGEGDAEVDGVLSEAAGVGQENAFFGIGDGLRQILEMLMQFTSCQETAELKIDVARAVGEGSGAVEVLGGAGGVIGQEKAS